MKQYLFHRAAGRNHLRNGASAIQRFWTNLLTSGLTDDQSPLMRRIRFSNIVNTIISTVFIVFGMVNYFSGQYLSFIVELAGGLFGIFILLQLRASRNCERAQMLIMAALTIELSYLLATGGIARTGIFWLFCLPAAAFFMRGRRRGWMWLAVIVVEILIMMGLSAIAHIKIPYSVIELRQFLASFIAVSIGVYQYEKMRNDYEKALDTNNLKILESNAKLLCQAEERERAEIALRENEARYRQLVDNTDTGFVVVDDKGTVIEANEPYLRLIGVEKTEEVVGHSVIEWTAPEEQARNAEAVALCSRRGFIKDFETIYLHRNGTRVHISINATTHETAAGKRIVSFCRDITKRKQAEEALQASEEKYRMLVEHQGEGIIIADFEELITYSNPAADAILGVPTGTLAGRRITEFISRESAERMFQETSLRKQGKKSKYELEVIRQDGGKRTLLLTAVPQTDDFGQPVGTLGILQDVTEQRQTEKLQAALYFISESAAKAENLQSLYAVIHDAVKKLVNTNNFYIALYDEKDQMISFPYHVDEFDQPPQPRKMGDGITDYVIKTGIPLLTTPSNPSPIKGKGLTMVGTPSIEWAGVPMKVGGRVMGALVVQTYREAEKFGEHALEILSFMSDNIALAIERKNVEEALRVSEERFKQVADNAAEWVWEVDPEGIYTYSSPVGEKILGYAPDELIEKKHFYDMFTPETRDELSREAQSGFAQRLPIKEFVNPNIHKDGRVVILETNGVPYFGPDGTFLGYRGTDKDITMKRALEEERELLIIELQDSLDNIKTLKGLVPICASCKKIRNDGGYWQQVEEYVSEHTEADFSHGLCDECAHKLYPGYFADKKNKEKE